MHHHIVFAFFVQELIRTSFDTGRVDFNSRGECVFKYTAGFTFLSLVLTNAGPLRVYAETVRLYINRLWIQYIVRYGNLLLLPLILYFLIIILFWGCKYRKRDQNAKWIAYGFHSELFGENYFSMHLGNVVRLRWIVWNNTGYFEKWNRCNLTKEEFWNDP